jgi:PAS domain S-box-containing protein
MVFRRLIKWATVIVKHKQFEQVFRHLAMVTEQADEGVVVISLNGIIHLVNTAWARMHGYKSSSELVGKEIRMFYTKEQLESRVIPLANETKRRGRFAGMVEHMRADGTMFPTQTKMTLIKDEQGKAIGLIVSITDITNRRRLEEALAKTTNQSKELAAANERLQRKIIQNEQAEESLRQHAATLAAANEQLQGKIAQSEQAEESLRQHAAALAAANEQLQGKIAQSEQAGESLKQQAATLAAANEQLQQEISELEQAEEVLRESTEQEEPEEPTAPPLDFKKLEALSELAKELRREKVAADKANHKL